MRCDHCGRDEQNAKANGSTHCAPPFTVVRHSFTGRHPADIREAAERAPKHDYGRQLAI